MGSLTIPSHLRNDAGLGFSRACRSSGMITVGPVTIRMLPKSTATPRLMSAMT